MIRQGVRLTFDVRMERGKQEVLHKKISTSKPRQVDKVTTRREYETTEGTCNARTITRNWRRRTRRQLLRVKREETRQDEAG